MKNSNDTIGNRTHDLRACSVVPQPTAPPRAPDDNSIETNINVKIRKTLCYSFLITFNWFKVYFGGLNL